MIPVIRNAGWLAALRDRLTVTDFKRAGAVPPSFFISANAIDCKRGKVVDIVSGAEATFMGGASISYINRPKIDQKDTTIYRLPAIDLTGSAYLSFGNLPILASGVRSFQLTAWVLPTELLSPTQAGLPTARRRTLLSRALRNPGGVGTSLSGWRLGMAQYKAAVSSTTYNRPGLLYDAMLSSTVYVRTDPDQNTFMMWNSTVYPYGDSHIKELSIYVYSDAASAIPKCNWFSPWGWQWSTTLASNSATSGIDCLLDNASNPLMVGATLDANTGTYATDFFDGKLLALGMWINRNRGESIYGYLGVGPMKRALIEVGRSLNNKGNLSVAPPPEPAKRYVSNTSHALLPALAVGAVLAEGDIFTVGGKVFRVLIGGTLAQPVAVPTSATTNSAVLGYHKLAGVVGEILVEEVTGDAAYPAASFDVLPRIQAGDTLVIKKDHVLGRGLYTTTQTIIVDPASMLIDTSPVRVVAEDGAAISTGSALSIISVMGNVVFDNVTFKGYGVRISLDGGRLTVIGLRSEEYAEVVGFGDIKLFDCGMSPILRYIPIHGTGQPFYDGDRATDYTIFGRFPESCGPTLISMYGGTTSGRAPEYGIYWGGSFIYMYGVCKYGRGGREASGQLGDRQSSLHTASAFIPSSAYVVSKEGRLVIRGGIPGMPVSNQIDHTRTAPVEFVIDSLRGPRYVSPLRASYDRAHPNTYASGRKKGSLGRFGGVRRIGIAAIPMNYPENPLAATFSSAVPSPRLYSPRNVPAWALGHDSISVHTNMPAGATGVRIYFYCASSQGNIAPISGTDIRIKYIHATTKRRVLLRILSIPSVTVITAPEDWALPIHAAAAYADIPLPNCLPGPVEVLFYARGIPAQGTLDYFDSTIESYV